MNGSDENIQLSRCADIHTPSHRIEMSITVSPDRLKIQDEELHLGFPSASEPEYM